MSFVINLIGGPGAGKSTTAAGVFFLLKLLNVRCELVTEFAKELTYDENWSDLKRQLYVTAEQERRQRRLVDKVDFIVTDSPLLLGVFARETLIPIRGDETAAKAVLHALSSMGLLPELYGAYGTPN